MSNCTWTGGGDVRFSSGRGEVKARSQPAPRKTRNIVSLKKRKMSLVHSCSSGACVRAWTNPVEPCRHNGELSPGPWHISVAAAPTGRIPSMQGCGRTLSGPPRGDTGSSGTLRLTKSAEATVGAIETERERREGPEVKDSSVSRYPGFVWVSYILQMFFSGRRKSRRHFFCAS